MNDAIVVFIVVIVDPIYMCCCGGGGVMLCTWCSAHTIPFLISGFLVLNDSRSSSFVWGTFSDKSKNYFSEYHYFSSSYHQNVDICWKSARSFIKMRSYFTRSLSTQNTLTKSHHHSNFVKTVASTSVNETCLLWPCFYMSVHSFLHPILWMRGSEGRYNSYHTGYTPWWEANDSGIQQKGVVVAKNSETTITRGNERRGHLKHNNNPGLTGFDVKQEQQPIPILFASDSQRHHTTTNVNEL